MSGLYLAGPFAGQGIFWETVNLSQPGTLVGLVLQTGGNSSNGNVRVALYNGSSLVAQSSPMVVSQTFGAWNTFPMPATYLNPGGYTLAFQTENVPSAIGSLANFVTLGNTIGYTGTYLYAPFPSTMPPPAYSTNGAYIGFYALYCPAPTWTNTPTPNATLFTATPSPTVTPTPVIHWTESTASVNAAGGRQGQSSVTLNGNMWVIAGRNSGGLLHDVLYSSNGAVWNTATSNAAFSIRQSQQSVVFDNRMWVIGGANGVGSMNDVWSSSDGVNWTQATAAAPFTSRCEFSSVVFNPYTGSGSDGAIWVMAGENTGGIFPVIQQDVWYSQDGANWTEATANAAFGLRWGHASVVFNNKIWVIGGANPATSYPTNDVWSSSDGVNWTQATAAAAFPARYNFTTLVYNNLMWVIGGYGQYGGALNDVWSSPDGVNWTEQTAGAEFPPRAGHSSVVFNNEIWAICGYSGSAYLNDAWHWP